MKAFIAIILVAMASSTVLAQLRQQPDSVIEMQKVAKSRSLRNGGILFTIIGGGLFIGGVVTAVNSIDFYNSSANTGEGLVIAGAVLVGAGIPMIAVGTHNYRKYNRKVMGVTAPSSLVQQRDLIDTTLYKQKVFKYRNLKTAGIILTIIGGGLLIAGASRSNDLYFNYGQSASTRTAEGLLVAGSILVGVGIPMIAVGTHNYRKYKHQLQGPASARLTLHPRINGLSVVLHY